MPLKESVGKFLVGVLQIGSGSSLGREGPTVQICAGIANSLGHAAGLSVAATAVSLMFSESLLGFAQSLPAHEGSAAVAATCDWRSGYRHSRCCRTATASQ